RDAVFRDVVASRPGDTRPWLARGQWLAWHGRWDEALSAYDRYLATLAAPQDAHFERAGVLLMSRGAVAYRGSVADLVVRFGSPASALAGYVLARAGAMAQGALDDPGRLVRWAEPLVAASPEAGWPRHTLGLAHLRAGQYEQAVRHFERSMKDDPGWRRAAPV